MLVLADNYPVNMTFIALTNWHLMTIIALILAFLSVLLTNMALTEKVSGNVTQNSYYRRK